ncbi:MAG: TonB-dependent receptor, partial [Chitinophagales bacterium]
ETNRTFNPYTYENQTDNYTQTHYQWHNTFYFKNDADVTVTFNYTKGKGYYEQLEEDQFFSDYGVNDLVLSGDTIFSSDLITQKWLDNDFYGAYLQYRKDWKGDLGLNFGGAFYQYAGDHFGKVTWAEYTQPFGINYEWYRNDALKNDANIFSIFSYEFTEKLAGYLDLQLRSVQHRFEGFDEDGLLTDQQVDLLFFNPKIGVSYEMHDRNLFYFSLAKSSHEPNRYDYIESSPLSRPNPEKLYDAEAGNKLNVNGWQLYSTLFFMYYQDQLILTGRINDVGAYTRVNVPVSYRAGAELAWAKTFFETLQWQGNISVSQNKIQEFTEYTDNWDTGEQLVAIYTNTSIAFSPSLIAANKIEQLVFSNEDKNPSKNLSFSVALQSKYVSRQFIDNTSHADRALEPYFLHDLLLNFRYHSTVFRELNLGFTVQNTFNTLYESNAWVYKYIYEGEHQELNGYFPQAGRTFVAIMRVKF